MTKICTKCGRELSKSKFYKDKGTSDGLYPSCKICKKLSVQKSYIKHAEARKAQKRQYTKTEAGRLTDRRHYNKRRGYGCVPLNEYFEGAHFHHLHIHDDDEGIFIPEYLHTYVYHNSSTWQGMDIMNVIALLYLMSEKLNGDRQWEL
jgi:hypothetical protein